MENMAEFIFLKPIGILKSIWIQLWNINYVSFKDFHHEQFFPHPKENDHFPTDSSFLIQRKLTTSLQAAHSQPRGCCMAAAVE